MRMTDSENRFFHYIPVLPSILLTHLLDLQESKVDEDTFLCKK